MTADKTATKTARSPRNGAEIPLGAHPGNTGGKKGRSGRKPGVFKDFLVKLRQNPKFLKALQDAATDSTHPNFKAALGVITDYDDEKPADRTDLTLRVVFGEEGPQDA